MRDFLKSIFATIIGLGLFTAVGVGGLLMLLVAIATSTQEMGPRVEKNSILTLDLSQEITDTNPSSDPSGVITAVVSGGSLNRPIALRSVLQSIEQAAEDDRIAGLYVYGNTATSGGSGLATLREVRQALQTFRDRGKPIYAYSDEAWRERDYYLASVADTIFQHPSSVLELNGLNLENIFFAEALQKYGIGVQALRVGKYKSAIEPFTRNDSSPEEREQTQKLLNDLWNEFLITTSKSRDIPTQQLQTIANQQAILLSDQAQSAGLVDEIAYRDEVVTELHKLTGEDETADSFRQINLSEYASAVDREQGSSNNQIAVVYAEGNIVDGSGASRSIGGDSLAETLRDVRQDETVKAVVLRVNSPGGSAIASEQITREVLLTTKEKPVIVSMGNYAASGGYQIATHANRIFASPNTITGSIGVFGLLPNFQDIANRNGITWDNVKTGQFADIETVSRPKTPEELAIVQRVVDQVYDKFLTIVAESRNLPREKVNEIAQGRVWSGAEAQKIGLVDELGGLDDAIQAAATEANLEDDWQLVEYPAGSVFWFEGLFQNYLKPYLASSTTLDPLTLEFQKLQDDLEDLRSMNDPLGVYMRLPFNPRID
ncbi:signal peptide peptidase SppA [Thermocoleostomius sinensis]|uniref:Protease 4 n=1 Tax=Thermocoleostomius sinensis A174 TaxID=2016057 RepID=A0A9E8ZNL7_9CYAN|nr:signal peptide peptidase SppA [Thermocoleostomius sinensis]WAL61871.1 signal peptide peptidase SppA [Thermocoleostomius sinensis A174]